MSKKLSSKRRMAVVCALGFNKTSVRQNTYPLNFKKQMKILLEIHK